MAVPKKGVHHDDISTLTANGTSQDKKNCSLTTSIENNKVKNEQSFLSLQGNRNNSSTNERQTNISEHSWFNHYGMGKEFSDKPSFLV